MSNVKIKNALLSVSNKENLLDVVKVLNKFKIKIISSGGTYKFLKKKGYKSTEISKYTGFKEMLDGRVKTLHPKIHAGILHDRKKKTHLKEMKGKKFPSIDLIIVNFYPFQKVITETKNHEHIINNIDIGGPTMVRAAAKNFKNVSIITNIEDYKEFIRELLKGKGSTKLEYREKLASKAFCLTAYYDAMITNWFNKKLQIDFPDKKVIFGRKYKSLRYGENPHQKAAIYINDFKDRETGLKKIHGKDLSFNNYSDIYSSLDILSYFKKSNTTVIIKHGNPCGVSSNRSRLSSFKNAFACDPVSAFGGIIACNFKIDKKTATEITKNFCEVVISKGFDRQALNILKSKKNLRLINFSKYKNLNKTITKFFDNSFLMQEKNQRIMDSNKLRFVSKIKPSKKDLKELEFANKVCKFVKSNAIVITKDMSTIGIGAGQPSRLDSCKIAIQKAKLFRRNKVKNSYAASDAFFPFKDGIKTLAKAGVKTVVQPGGSLKDKEVIEEADNNKLKMILTGLRHFNH